MDENEILTSVRRVLESTDFADVCLTKDDINALARIIIKEDAHEDTNSVDFRHMTDMLKYYIKGYRDAFKDSSDGDSSWIPVEEALPENFRDVIVTEIDIEGHRYTDVSRYGEATKGWLTALNDVIAWEPMPTPYKG